MSEQKVTKIYERIIYLMGCALNGIEPDVDYLSVVPTEDICKYANAHSVGALVTYALERAKIAPAEAVTEKNMAIRKILLLDAERAALTRELEARKIKYMPLKGVYLKEYYPAIGLRQMADNDILFDPEYRREVRRIFESRGYTVESYEGSNHDVYLKAPVYNYEMHVSLFDSYHRGRLADYFSDPFSKAVRIAGTEYGYKMTDEDFYIYVKAHEYKHFTSGGTGLRAFSDTYAFLSKRGEQLDRDYLDKEFKTLGIDEYVAKIESIARTLLGKDFISSMPEGFEKTLPEELYEIFRYMCQSGSYGIMEHNVDNDISRLVKDEGSVGKAKFKYIFRRMFPPMSYYKANQPFYYKHKYLIPFFVIKKLLRNLFVTPKYSFKYLGKILGYKGKKEKK